MSDMPHDDGANAPEPLPGSNARDMSEAGLEFDDELHDAEAEADDTLKS